MESEPIDFAGVARAIGTVSLLGLPLQSAWLADAAAVRIVVTLVHGTFASGAPWIQPNGPLTRQIRKAFLGFCRVEPFEWSGGNSVRDRWAATLDLRARLRSQRQMYPNARQFIIAHSHGGNIALYALADLDLARQVSGVACLATPFLIPTRRATTEPLLTDHAAPLAALMTGIMAALYTRFAAWQSWGTALLALGAVTGVLGGGLWLAGALHRWLERRANHLLEQMPRTALDPQKLRIIRTPLDEAWAALAFTRLASGLLSLFWRVVTRPLWVGTRWLVNAWAYNKAPGAIKRLISLIQGFTQPTLPGTTGPVLGASYQGRFIGQVGTTPSWKLGLAEAERSARREQLISLVKSFLPLMYPLLAAAVSNFWFQAVGLVLVIAYGLPAILALIVSLLLVPFSVFVGVGLLLQGWDLPVGAPFLDVVAEPVPTGSWNVTQFHNELAPGSAAIAEGLSHGRAHDDPRVHDSLLAWLRANMQPTPPPALP